MSDVHRDTRRRHPSSDGFTLLELLVVIGVISVLMGVSIGYLGKTDPMQVAAAVLGGEQRAAQLTARAEGVPSEVWVRPGGDGEPATVQARLLEPVVTFGFEPRTPVLDERLRPVLGGEDVEAGRFGHARRPGGGERSRAPMLRWPVARQALDVGSGFVLRFDIQLEERSACLVVDMAPTLELRLDERSRPEARVRLTGPNGENVRARVAGSLGLPLRRWATLEVGCDGETVWLAIDGREVGRAPAAGAPQQADDTTFVLGSAEDPFVGMVDEVRWFVFAWSQPQALPAELQPKRAYRFTWDQNGVPVEQPTIEYENLGGGA